MISKQKKLERVQISTNKNVIDYVISAMENGFYARGPHLKKLQNVLKNKFDKKYAILTTNGFSSLFLTLKALNLPKKNQVTTASAGTCFAMVNAIKAAGLKPKFVDLEKKTLSIQTKNLSSDKLNNNIVIIPNHFGLISEGIRNKLKNNFIIEDAAQSFMSSLFTNTSSDVRILSFYPTKWVNGIDGGAILTDNSKLASRLEKLVSYADQIKGDRIPRYNMAMSNIHAACVLGSLKNLANISKKLMRNYHLLSDGLNTIALKHFPIKENEVPSRFICMAKNLKQRDFILKEMKAKNIDVSKELAWITNQNNKSLFPVAKTLIERSFSIPFHPYLNKKDISRVTKNLSIILNQY